MECTIPKLTGVEKVLNEHFDNDIKNFPIGGFPRAHKVRHKGPYVFTTLYRFRWHIVVDAVIGEIGRQFICIESRLGA